MKLQFTLLFVLPLAAATPPSQIDEAFNRMYNFDFRGADAVLDRYIAAQPAQALPYAARSAGYLFSELDRLGILESEFFSDDRNIADKKKLKPDPVVRDRFWKAIGDAQQHGDAILRTHPDDRDALFAMCITQGVASDYVALVDKRQIASLKNVRRSTVYAQRLLQVDPHYYDAYLTTGVTEYIVGSLPFFIRWFVHIDNIEGSKTRGIGSLELVAQKGHLLKPFAKILLGIAHLREKRPRATEKLLEELSRDYPQNPLFRRELVKVKALPDSGRGGD
jgi:hypothetical protein